MSILLLAVFICFVTVVVFINQPSFGRSPRGARLERIVSSPNYRNNKFQNISPTKQITSDKSMAGLLFNFLFQKVENLRPSKSLPTVKTDLKQFDRNTDVMVWLGHSSLFIQTNGKRFLVDPVLVAASPIPFTNKAFEGTNIYSPDNLPDIDYLIITHDHWDHLDYNTVKHLKNRVGKVICALGVGEHLEYWGFNKEQIIELDWKESNIFDSGFIIHCLPARHFSGRGLSPNKTLWASFMLQTPSRNIYIGGDSGYDLHFEEIGKQFEKIDVAILENGQYDKDWKYIHMMPDDLVKAAKDLKARRLMTVHNSKYALSKHAWNEPLENISNAAEKYSFNLMTPMIGEPVYLNDTTQVFSKWWRL